MSTVDHRMFRRVIGVAKARLAGVSLTALSATLLAGTPQALTLPPTPQYRFEVATIRLSNAADRTNRLGPTPQGGLRGENVTVSQLIAQAFGVRPFQIVDAPAWTNSQRFDVAALPDISEEAAPGAAGAEVFRDRVRQRLRALLMDRFGLVVRTENRPMPVYRLVAAGGGPKMVPSTAQETRRVESNSTMLRGTGMNMKTLADALSGILLRPVLDETNLSGTFNLSMQFADVRLQAAPQAPVDPGGAPAIFTAIAEQLGLRLESAEAPAPALVVERIQRPSEN